MFDKKAHTAVPINDMLARRWSGRAYDPRRPVEAEKLFACIEAARWSASCFGAQPWNYIICDKSGDEDIWRVALECLTEGNRIWAQHAPVIILAVAAEHFRHNGRPNRWAQYDCGAASFSLCLQAADLGLMSHQMGGFDAEKSRKDFGIPDGHTPMAMIAIGYQLPQEEIPDEMQEREFAPRRRDPAGEHFFYGRWEGND